MSDFIKNFSEISQNDVALVGGKGANLAALTVAGFSVPAGFCIITPAYREFLQHSDLEEKITAKILGVDLSVLENIQICGAVIRQLIMENEIPEGTKEAIILAYRKIPYHLTSSIPSTLRQAQDTTWLRTGKGEGQHFYVAVRSSATAEDLPDLSFAGQHDTYLNISGESDLLFYVQKCWASLWSDRAIAYRHKNQIDHLRVFMAVVVQQMVPSGVSGVTFTANPVTHQYNELMINANWGLGESVVSGKATPDEYIVDKERLVVKNKNIGAKTMMITLGENGAVEVPVPLDQQTQPCLSDEQIQQLAFIGKQIENHFGAPQDIEWGISENQTVVLQSRPITTLKESSLSIPVMWGNQTTRKLLRDKVVFWANFNVRETMPYPQTPLNWSLLIECILPAVTERFSGITQDSALYPYGCGIDLVYGRVYWNMNILYGNPFWGIFFRFMLPLLDRETGMVFDKLYRDGMLPALKFSSVLKPLIVSTLKTVWRFLRLPWLINAEEIERRTSQYWQEAVTIEKMDFQGKSISQLLLLVREFTDHSARVCFPLLMVAGNALLGLKIIAWLTRKRDDVSIETFMAGIPGNKTTEGALELYKLSEIPTSLRSIFSCKESDKILSLLESSETGKQFLERLERFLEIYGHRGAKEMDVGTSRWKEDPSFVFQMFHNYWQLNAQDTTPVEHFHNLAQERERLTALVNQRLSQGLLARLFPWKKWLFNTMLRRVHLYLPLRENQKFYGLKGMYAVRVIFREIGRRLCDEGYLETADDVFFLMLPELEALAQKENGSNTALKLLVQQRKEAWHADFVLDPPFFVRSDGRPISSGEHELQEGNALQGIPASNGRVTGTARIILDPAEGATFNKGEILVAPFTDPGWTPLFLTAKALVMEVGGVMCHGAVVAREYGIPAVVGVKHATKTIHTGDEITVDGDQGRIFLNT